MAALTIQAATAAGLNLTFAAATIGGDTVANNEQTFIRVKNGHASNQSVTATAVYPCSHGFLHTVTVSVPAGAERDIGPFDASRFGDPVSLTYPLGVTLLTVAAVTL